MLVPSARISVRSDADAHRARRAARDMARVLGADPARSEAAALAAMELATNLVRYAGEGIIQISQCGGPGTGLTIESHDSGPGIGSPEKALTDGYSTGGGMGSGLPAVKRLMDEFEISSSAFGTHIVTRLWVSQS